MITLIATKPHRYPTTVVRAAGDEYKAKRQDATILVTLGKAKYKNSVDVPEKISFTATDRYAPAGQRQHQRRDIRPEQPPAAMTTKNFLKAETPSKPAPQPVPAPPAPVEPPAPPAPSTPAPEAQPETPPVATGPQLNDGDDEHVALIAMTKAQLVDVAVMETVPILSTDTKPMIIEKIRQARAAKN